MENCIYPAVASIQELSHTHLAAWPVLVHGTQIQVVQTQRQRAADDQVQDGLGPHQVLGVIPEALTPREVSHELIGDTKIVGDMHERKAAMARAADGFIAMPGGLGTLEELLEVMTWQQLGFHAKPIGLLNVEGFYDPLLSFFDHCVKEGFVKAEHQNVVVSPDPAELVRLMLCWVPPTSNVLADAKDRAAAIGEDISKGSAVADGANNSN